jgi:hypothetical protein
VTRATKRKIAAKSAVLLGNLSILMAGMRNERLHWIDGFLDSWIGG